MNSVSISSHAAAAMAIVCYLSSTALLARRTLRAGTASNSTTGLIGATALAAALLHGWSLLSPTFAGEGLQLGFFNALSVTAWFTTAIVLFLNIGRPALNLGLIFFPVSSVVIVLTLLTREAGFSTDPQLQWHALTSIIAYALLTVAAGQAVLVSLQDRRLHNHRPGGILNVLPPLKVMETVLFHLLSISFILLSLSLITGFVFLENLMAQRLVHKTLLSISAWFFLAALLTGHFFKGWRGQKAAAMTLGAYILLVIGYFGSKLVKEIILG